MTGLKKRSHKSVVKKEKPNLAVSGALAADVNSYKGIVLKYRYSSVFKNNKIKTGLKCCEKRTAGSPRSNQEVQIVCLQGEGADRHAAGTQTERVSVGKRETRC